MAATSRTTVLDLCKIFEAPNGLAAEYTALVRQVDPEQVESKPLLFHRYSIATDAAEKGLGLNYPCVFIYCDRVVNTLSEKFRRFSGTADLSIEIRVTHDHADQVTHTLDLYIEAATNVLDRNRGNWNTGTFYTGGYDVQYSPVKRGGKGFVQAARIKLQVHLGRA